MPTSVRPEHDSNSQSLFLSYAALALAKGEAVTPRDVHNTWAAWMASIDPTHEAIVPFEQLDRQTQADDDPFVRAIREVSASMLG